MSMTRVPSTSRPRPLQSARAWAAAKSEYLAGAEAEAVCRRHDIRTAYFLRLAGEQGWRHPEPTPTVQNDPLVIPDAPPGASRDRTEALAPLTATQIADKAWTHVQAAIAAGRQIEARGWMRLYKDLQPFARKEAATLRAAEQARDDAARLQFFAFGVRYAKLERHSLHPVTLRLDRRVQRHRRRRVRSATCRVDGFPGHAGE